MRIASPKASKVELLMTPMIDVVFQLLIFFVMSFRIAVAEGDFDVTMPSDPVARSWDADEVPQSIQLRLKASDSGEFAAIEMNQAAVRDLREVRRLLMAMAGAAQRGPERGGTTPAVTIEADYGLRYEHVMAAITAVSGAIGADGTRIHLAEQVRLAPPRP